MMNLSLAQVSRSLRISYPLWMIVGMYGLMYVPSEIYLMGSAVETAQNIQSNEFFFRSGIAARLVTQLFGILIPVLLFMLFKAHDRMTASFMLMFSLLGVPISMMAEAFCLTALTVVDSPELMMSYLDLSRDALDVASIFWGLWLFPIGMLAKNSGFFPKWIGYALLLAGVGYLLGAFLKILFPEADMMFSITEWLTIGEVVFILWFVIRGVDSSKFD